MVNEREKINKKVNKIYEKSAPSLYFAGYRDIDSDGYSSRIHFLVYPWEESKVLIIKKTYNTRRSEFSYCENCGEFSHDTCNLLNYQIVSFEELVNLLLDARESDGFEIFKY